MNDVIELRELRCSAIVGVLAEERERAQPLVFDLDLVRPFEEAAINDDIAETTNYADVLGAHRSAPRPRVATCLLETLAYRVAYEVLAFDEEIASVTVVGAQGPSAGRRGRRVGRRSLQRSTPVVRRAYLSLGSNIGDRRAHLAAGVDVVRANDDYRTSSVYETEPQGGVAQDDYWNIVVELDDRGHGARTARTRARRRGAAPTRA